MEFLSFVYTQILLRTTCDYIQLTALFGTDKGPFCKVSCMLLSPSGNIPALIGKRFHCHPARTLFASFFYFWLFLKTNKNVKCIISNVKGEVIHPLTNVAKCVGH